MSSKTTSSDVALVAVRGGHGSRMITVVGCGMQLLRLGRRGAIMCYAGAGTYMVLPGAESGPVAGWKEIEAVDVVSESEGPMVIRDQVGNYVGGARMLSQVGAVHLNGILW